MAKQAEIGVGDYVAWGHVVASPEGALHGSVDDALAELGTKRKIASVVPGFPTALSVALESDLIAMIPALYLLNQQVTDQVHVFELPFKSRRITVSQMWHPRMERDPGHRWLRKQILAICGGGGQSWPDQIDMSALPSRHSDRGFQRMRLMTAYGTEIFSMSALNRLTIEVSILR